MGTSAGRSSATSVTRVPPSGWGRRTTLPASGSARRSSVCRSSCSKKAGNRKGNRLMSTTTNDASEAPIKFAYWVPNVSGGLVVSKIEQRTHWDYDYNKKLAVLAENSGFEYALSQVRYMASYGAENQHESTSFSLALLLATERLKVIAAVHPGLWQPGVLAKLLATADHLSGGRAAVNVVSGWFKDEFTKLGEPWLEHDERYRRSEEFIRVLREIWTSEQAEFAGDFYRLHDFDLKPKPLAGPGRPHPEIFQGGNSTAARRMA